MARGDPAYPLEHLVPYFRGGRFAMVAVRGRRYGVAALDRQVERYVAMVDQYIAAVAATVRLHRRHEEGGGQPLTAPGRDRRDAVPLAFSSGRGAARLQPLPAVRPQIARRKRRAPRLISSPFLPDPAARVLGQRDLRVGEPGGPRSGPGAAGRSPGVRTRPRRRPARRSQPEWEGT